MPAKFIQSRPGARRPLVSKFGMLVLAGLVFIIMMLPAPALAGSALPRGFVYLRDIDPTIVQDIRYAGFHNFVGRPIRGYLAAECILSVSAANALETVRGCWPRKSSRSSSGIAIVRSGLSMIFFSGAKIQPIPK
jgi:D-alanyl-D-alanine dipeptidase